MVKRLFFDNLYYVARSAKNRLAACGVNFLSFFRKKFTPSDGPAHKGRKAVFGLFFKKQTEPLGEETNDIAKIVHVGNKRQRLTFRQQREIIARSEYFGSGFGSVQFYPPEYFRKYY